MDYPKPVYQINPSHIRNINYNNYSQLGPPVLHSILRLPSKQNTIKVHLFPHFYINPIEYSNTNPLLLIKENLTNNYTYGAGRSNGYMPLT